MSETSVSVHVVDDDVSVREAVESLIRSAGWRVETFASAQEFLSSSRKNIPSCLVLDVDLPGLNGLDLQQQLAKDNFQVPIVFLTGHGDIPMTVRALKAGATDFLTKPIDDEALLEAIREGVTRSNLWRKSDEHDSYEDITGSSPALKCALDQIRTVASTNSTVLVEGGTGTGKDVYLREEIDRSSMFEEIVGSSQVLREVLVEVSRVAPTDATVLILGETGTGKELIACAIHNQSTRASRAFIRVNCAAIPPAVIASELFGHEKGSFTGAQQRRLGRFELADSGTIFLDEVGDLPPETQIALLRVLQEREFERVGGNHTISVDVRVLAATNRDLNTAVTEGAFREDLFYRLNVFPIRLPPLRERVDDIPLLVEYLIDRCAQKAGKKIRRISKQSLDLFKAYDWPGNIRELQNVVERAVILCDAETFRVDESWLMPRGRKLTSSSAPPIMTLAEREKAVIENVLRETGGLVSSPAGAAAKLGIPRQTLEYKIRKLGINRYQFKTL